MVIVCFKCQLCKMSKSEGRKKELPQPFSNVDVNVDVERNLLWRDKPLVVATDAFIPRRRFRYRFRCSTITGAKVRRYFCAYLVRTWYAYLVRSCRIVRYSIQYVFEFFDKRQCLPLLIGLIICRAQSARSGVPQRGKHLP